MPAATHMFRLQVEEKVSSEGERALQASRSVAALKLADKIEKAGLGATAAGGERAGGAREGAAGRDGEAAEEEESAEEVPAALKFDPRFGSVKVEPNPGEEREPNFPRNLHNAAELFAAAGLTPCGCSSIRKRGRGRGLARAQLLSMREPDLPVKRTRGWAPARWVAPPQLRRGMARAQSCEPDLLGTRAAPQAWQPILRPSVHHGRRSCLCVWRVWSGCHSLTSSLLDSGSLGYEKHLRR